MKSILPRLRPWYLALFNVAGVVLSFFYGVAGGSGGETTEGVFLGIWMTGLTTLALGGIYLLAVLATRKWNGFDLLIILSMMALGYWETRILANG
ncbi:MAG TPA: hypothetical protein PKD45_11950 [Flavobacteriales bacterium]|nr:hypothetical protein [Flavobacteriales bacterium]